MGLGFMVRKLTGLDRCAKQRGNGYLHSWVTSLESPRTPPIILKRPAATTDPSQQSAGLPLLGPVKRRPETLNRELEVV